MIKAVLFDLDDTIIDHKNSSQKGLEQLRERVSVFNMLPRHEFEEVYQTLLEHFHQYVLSGEYTIEQARYERFKALFKHVNYEATNHEIEEVKALYGATYRQEERLIPGIMDLIQAIRDKGLQIGVVTNNTSEQQYAKLQRHNLESMFDAIVISEEVGIAKPDPQIFEFALNKLHRQVHDVVMLGDSWDSDVVGATSIGMKAVWLNRYNKSAPTNELIREITAYIPLDKVMTSLMNW